MYAHEQWGDSPLSHMMPRDSMLLLESKLHNVQMIYFKAFQ